MAMVATVRSFFLRIMEWLERIVHRVGVALCMLCPTVIPPGIAEPSKYRQVMAALWYAKFMALRAGRKHKSDTERVKTFRYIKKMLAKPLPPDPRVNVKVTEFDGVKVRHHEPGNRSDELLPGFIFFHGGGLALGSSEDYESITRDLCLRLNAVVVSVDYRLAPENLFPAAYDDCLKVSKWFLKNGRKYGVDLNRVAMGGDSAGGYLTTLMTLALRKEKGLPKIKIQLLIYPNVQFFDLGTPSYQKYHKIFGNQDGVLPNVAVPDFMSLYTKGSSNHDFLKAAVTNMHVSKEFKQSDLYSKHLNVTRLLQDRYCGDSGYFEGPLNEDKGDDQVWEKVKHFIMDRRFSPLIAEDFSDLPVAFIQTCGFDNLRDDGVIYAQKLQQAGVQVKHVNYEDGFHGIFGFQGPDGFKTGNKMMDDVIDFANTHL